VDGVDLDVAQGEFFTLLGPSGSGKTTTLRLIAGFAIPDAGTVELRGADVTRLPPYARDVNTVFQDYALFPHMSIGDNVEYGLKIAKVPREERHRRAAEALELVRLSGYEDRSPAQLSGGQRQRVGVARALAADPPLMLMDEPFGAIDPINRERLQNEFLRLQAELRKTIVFVTHDIDEAIKMGDKIAIMKQHGRVEQYATPAEVLMAPANEFVEDFVGADRALKRLALMRVRDISLWEAPLAHVGQATSEVRAKLDSPDVEVAYPLLVDSERRPLGWLSERDLAAETVPQRPDSPLGPVLELDDVMRDALADLLQGETQYAPVVDHERRIVGVLSVEIISEFLASPDAKSDEHPAVERPHD
jgi:osmoprotectant transport system ATP-binding protein